MGHAGIFGRGGTGGDKKGAALCHAGSVAKRSPNWDGKRLTLDDLFQTWVLPQSGKVLIGVNVG
jgi:hypothetical protein